MLFSLNYDFADRRVWRGADDIMSVLRKNIDVTHNFVKITTLRSSRNIKCASDKKLV